MSREIKRVPLDFDHPLEKTWSGYLQEKTSRPCPDCDHDGTGPHGASIHNHRLTRRWYGYDETYTPLNPVTPEHPEVYRFAVRQCLQSPDYYMSFQAVRSVFRRRPRTKKRRIIKKWRKDQLNWKPLNWRGERITVQEAAEVEAIRLAGLWRHQWSHHLSQQDVDALAAGGRLMDFTHTWSRESGWKPKVPAYRPKAREVNAWSFRGFGHDSINQWICVRARLEPLGLSTSCATCGGSGELFDSEESRIADEEWKETEPPSGEGYQLWETVSEGSPISPVFATPEELADWLVTPGNGSEVDRKTTREGWLSFIRGPGWAPSLVMVGGRVMTGVEAESFDPKMPFKAESDGHLFAPGDEVRLKDLVEHTAYNGTTAVVRGIRQDGANGKAYYVDGKISEVLDYVFESRLEPA